MTSMNLKVSRLEREFAEKQQELEKARRELAEQQALPEDYQLAEALHEMQCHLAHEDQCSWFYDSWENFRTRQYSSRPGWVAKADRVLMVVDFQTAMKVITALEGYD